ncbi:hypothetical protein K1T71_006131 [Dendrolimus kikuchii]|uniref:Uncharacterized protein n=1 Tax=Dendrolimus kikuchii TaxID=765133 RepID=A0ACC1D344_9NEOP|nr:hypothetical protein K1T71_006131 [Dendrolimus kikuchii]
MTSLNDTVDVTKEKFLTNSYKYKNTYFSKKSKHVLKSKENTYNIKCNKELKRKLKKYKLRHDGKEDQDVLDVSNFLITSLIIKSPNSKEQHQSNIEEIEYTRPKNYLFKMGRQNSRSNGTISGNNSKEKSLKESNVYEENTPSQSDNQLRKQTNAFQLLMDSRDKVIGSNSLGKEKSIEEEEEFKMIEKKELRMKRAMLLQKMAEAKGSLKKTEMEEYQECCIKKKMEKRAEKLRNMILNKETKTKKYTNKSDKVNSDKNAQINETAETNGMKLNTFQIVNMFNECEVQVKISPKKKQIPKDEEEFLKKLSPSLRKKENMLSYFKKLEKEVETTPEKSECDSLLIKVKLKTKNKNNNKRKLSLKKTTDSSKDLLLISNNNINKVGSQNLEISKDNKQKESINTLTNQPTKTNVTLMVNEERPKRNIKRPVKYVDDSKLSSSDEDCHIFTPKKKKSMKMPLKSKFFDNSSADVPLSVEKSKKLTKEKIMHKESQKKPVKLAPIFATKVQPSLVDIEAKNKFLQSGVPDQLKKRSIKQEVSSSVSTCFPMTVHIQQHIENTKNDTEMQHNIPLMDINMENCTCKPSDELYKSLIHVSNTQSVEKNLTLPTLDVNMMLKNIKQVYKRFPVYRTYRLLKDKNKGELKDHSYLELDNSVEIMNSFVDIWNENPDQLNWTSKFKSTSSKHIIGNFESIKELKKWLVQWTENEAKNKISSKDDSDFSDFYNSDTDSRESMKATNNLLIITGPVGCGKTSGVYAVAAELAFKVLEVNASGKRTGKIMLQDLHEATQSHKVNRGTSGTESSQKSQDFVNESSVSKPKKRGRPKKCNEKLSQKYSGIKTEISNGTQPSQETTRTAMSLILIDDADIVFEQDDGFCSAIVQLVQCSKRPVILITSTQSCVHLQRFFQIGKIIKMKPLLPRMLGTWLDLLCLANNGICWPGIGAKFLEYFKGDMRKTINYLQFYTQTENSNDDGITTSLDVDMNIQHLDDEKSNMSWVDPVDVENSDPLSLDINQIWTLFTSEMFDLVKSRHTIPLFNIWWNIPKLLNVSPDKSAVLDKQKYSELDSKNSQDHLVHLDSLANVIDAISISDLFVIKRADNACVTNLPWFTAETHSVSEHDNEENYTRAFELSEEISQEYVKSNILLALKYRSSGNLDSMPLDFPGMKIKREKARIVSRHNSLNTCLNPSAVLDRRALALDYWSSCRNICRIERTKTDNNSKRNNRFCHYLKSLNANCKSESFENLAESLFVKEID